MANVRFGGGVTDIRGSVGGSTFTRGAAGPVLRQRVKGINKNSTLQVALRAVVSMLSKLWSDASMDATRADWNAYAAGTPMQNRLGDPIYISGFSMFVRTNSLLLQAGGTVQSTAPTAPGQAGAANATILAVSNDGKISIVSVTGAFQPTVVGDKLMVFQALPQNAGRLGKAKGYRYIGVITGASSAPTFPVLLDTTYKMQAGQQVGVRLVHVDAIGRVNAPVDQLIVAAVGA